MTFTPDVHEGNPVILIRFKYNPLLVEEVKKLPGRKWSQTRKFTKAHKFTRHKKTVWRGEQPKTCVYAEIVLRHGIVRFGNRRPESNGHRQRHMQVLIARGKGKKGWCVKTNVDII
jgi:hypothetical protein